MEVRWSFILMLIGAAIVTIIPRTVPLVILSRLHLPNTLLRWMEHIPVAVMSALLAQELLLDKGSWQPQPIVLWSALASFVAAYFTRSLLITVIVGIAVLALLTRL